MRSERGFTLIETLVAFAILAVTLTALYASLGTGLRGLARAGNAEEAALFAESRLEEVRAARLVPDGESSGAFEGTAYRWRLTPVVEQTPESGAPTSPIVPRRVKLAITWEEEGHKRDLSVETIILVRTELGK